MNNLNDFNPMEDNQFKEVVLEKLQFYLNVKIDKSEFYEMNVEQIEFYLRQLTLTIKGEFMGERILKDIKVDFELLTPLNCWEHFKLDYFSTYLLTKFPIKYKTHKEVKIVKIERCFIFPKAFIPNDNIFGRYIIRDMGILNK